MKLKNVSESSIFDDLKNPEFAAGYLEEVMQDGSLDAFLIALRNVTEANGGVGHLAKATELGRESMYKTLSEEGNPQFATVQTILKALGLKLSITPADKEAH